MKSKYNLIKTTGSFCPKCDKEVYLLSHHDGIEEPAFFICFDCKTIGQVGIGKVTCPK